MLFFTQPKHGPSRLARRRCYPCWDQAGRKIFAVASSIQNGGGCRGQGDGTCCVRRDSTEILESAPASVGDGECGTCSPTAGRVQAMHTSQPIPTCRVGWSRVQDKPWVVGGSESEQLSRSSGPPIARDRRASFDTGCADDMQSSVIGLLSCGQAGKHCCKLPNGGLWVVSGDPTLRPVSSRLSLSRFQLPRRWRGWEAAVFLPSAIR